MAETKTFRTFAENLPTIFRKIIFREISPKSFSRGFPLIFKFSENCPKTYRELPEELITREFYRKRFPELETILVDVRFQFCLAAESIGQDGAGAGAILPDDQPIKLRESRAG